MEDALIIKGHFKRLQNDFLHTNSFYSINNNNNRSSTSYISFISPYMILMYYLILWVTENIPHNTLLCHGLHNQEISSISDMNKGPLLFSSSSPLKCPDWLPSTAQVKKVWSCTFTLPFATTPFTGAPFYWQFVNITDYCKRWKQRTNEKKKKNKQGGKEGNSDLNLGSLSR